MCFGAPGPVCFVQDQAPSQSLHGATAACEHIYIGGPRALRKHEQEHETTVQQQEHIYRRARSAQRHEFFYYFNRFLCKFLGSFFLCCGVVVIGFHVF